MCGIIGYAGMNDAAPILLDGLKSMEYRGYDSVGLCVKNKDHLIVLKKKGKVIELAQNSQAKMLKGVLGLAHTRWATHGEPNEINAHPHFDCNKNIAIVHNGIIENYDSLKNLLKKEGHKFTSQTDSETLAHLIEKFYKGDLIDSVSSALHLVEGTYGLLVIDKNNGKMIAARKGSPLLIGLGKKEIFAASDISAIIKYTNKVIYLEDGEIAEFDQNRYTIKDLQGNSVKSKISKVSLKSNQIKKGNFKHFMLKEIFEQPEAIRNTLIGKLKDGKIILSLKANLSNTKKIILLGCGTSWHSALVGKYIIEKITSIPVEVDYSSEFRYRDPIIDKDDLVIVISQSGETADTLAALQEAKSKGAQTLGIVNVVGSSIAREVDSAIYLNAGPEIGVASTKAFTSQIVNIILLSLSILQKNGKNISGNIIEEISNLPSKIDSILEGLIEPIQKAAKMINSCENVLYLGRGANYPVALEGALKLKEISYIHAEGYPAAEMKHGPIALVDENLPSIFLAPNDRTYKKTISNMQEIKARKGKIIAIVNKKDENLIKIADHVIQIPESSEEISPILNTIVLQLLAYYVADLRGLDIDKPRNLAKSVTVE